MILPIPSRALRLVGILVLAFATFLAVYFFTAMRRAQDHATALEEKVTTLEARLTAASSARNSEKIVSREKSHATTIPEVSDAAPKEMPNADDDLFNMMTSITSEHQVAEIESHVVVDQTQREKLREFFADQLKHSMAFVSGEERNPGPFMNYEARIKEILGEEKYRVVEKKREEQLERSEREQLDQRGMELARKLDLSREQETRVRTELENVSRKMVEARDGDFDQSEFMKNIAEENTTHDIQTILEQGMSFWKRYEEYEAMEKKELAARLKPILTEEQYNKLLEIQATETP